MKRHKPVKEKADSQPEKKGKSKKKKTGGWIDLVCMWMLCVGICLIAYPTVSDWWNSFHQTQVMDDHTQTVMKLDTSQRDRMRQEAQAYNKELLGRGHDRWRLSEEEKARYNSLLNPGDNGVMAMLSIPSLGLKYPIYHGTEEKVLQQAIGHMEGSSLPTGEPGTHALLTGHRGLPSAILFTHLDRLKKGDTFTIDTLGETLTYEVDQIKVVVPEDSTYVGIDPGQSYVTLVTCTPYEINTHRLLVRGHRVENAPEPEPAPIPWDRVALCLLMLLILIALIVMRIREKQKRRKRKKQQEQNQKQSQ